jgi:hypothetical protein
MAGPFAGGRPAALVSREAGQTHLFPGFCWYQGRRRRDQTAGPSLVFATCGAGDPVRRNTVVRFAPEALLSSGAGTATRRRGPVRRPASIPRQVSCRRTPAPSLSPPAGQTTRSAAPPSSGSPLRPCFSSGAGRATRRRGPVRRPASIPREVSCGGRLRPPCRHLRGRARRPISGHRRRSPGSTALHRKRVAPQRAPQSSKARLAAPRRSDPFRADIRSLPSDGRLPGAA